MTKISATVFLSVCFVAQNSWAQTSNVSWWVFGMGGGSSAFSNAETKSTVGQLFVGSTQIRDTLIESGFLVDTVLRGLPASVTSEEGLPTVFSLSQNYPNPFNPTTTILYSVPHRASVRVTVYDILGRRIVTLVNEVKEPGVHTLNWNALNEHGLPISSGVYFYRFQTDEFVHTKKLLLLR